MTKHPILEGYTPHYTVIHSKLPSELSFPPKLFLICCLLLGVLSSPWPHRSFQSPQYQPDHIYPFPMSLSLSLFLSREIFFLSQIKNLRFLICPFFQLHLGLFGLTILLLRIVFVLHPPQNAEGQLEQITFSFSYN